MNEFLNFLQSGTFWTAIGSIGTIVGLIVSVKNFKKRGSKTETKSVTERGKNKLLPLEIIRQKSEVRELRPLEVGKELHKLPNGIFGFTVPWVIDENTSSSLTLNQKMGGTAQVEVHKTVTGEIKIIGYVNQSTLIRIEDPSRITPIETEVFVKSYAEFSHPVAISNENILQCKNRSIEDAYLWDMILK
jgi:hypothetical protein